MPLMVSYLSCNLPNAHMTNGYFGEYMDHLFLNAYPYMEKHGTEFIKNVLSRQKRICMHEIYMVYSLILLYSSLGLNELFM